MKTKTYMAETAIKIDELTNEFEENHNVKFTQTGTIVWDTKIWHKTVIFYTP